MKAIHLVRNEWDGMVHGRFFAFNGDWGSFKGSSSPFSVFFFSSERESSISSTYNNMRACVRACV